MVRQTRAPVTRTINFAKCDRDRTVASVASYGQRPAHQHLAALKVTVVAGERRDGSRRRATYSRFSSDSTRGARLTLLGCTLSLARSQKRALGAAAFSGRP